MQGFCLCQKNKSSIVCQTKFSCGDTDVKLIKSSCVLHNLLMLMKLEWNISYFDRPFLFYEIFCSFKDAVAQCDFPPDFQSTFSGKLIGIDCWGGHIWYNFTIDFRLQFIFYIFVYLYMGKSHCNVMIFTRVDWKSEALLIFSRLQTLWSPFDLDCHTVLF